MERTILPVWTRVLYALAPRTGAHSIKSQYDDLNERYGQRVQLHLKEHERAEESARQARSLQERLRITENLLSNERAVNQALREQLRQAAVSNEQNRLSTSVAAPEDTAALEPGESDGEITLTKIQLRDITQTTRAVPLADVRFLSVVPLHQKHTAIDD